jgi:uncharacterized phiE125 gp8 family phage protein
MGLQLVTPPEESFVGLTTLKSFLRIDHDEQNSLLQTLLAAETTYAEGFTGRPLVLQTWDYYQDEFPTDGAIHLPLDGVTAVSAVYYLDSAGGEQTLDAADYDVDLASRPVRVALASGASWPTSYEGINAVRVRFTAGAANAEDYIADLQLAIMLRVKAGYDGGDQAQALRDAADVYLKRRRVIVSLA